MFIFGAAVFAGVGCFIFYRWFHRVPKRKTPPDPGLVIAPADGVIWQIVSLDGEERLKIPKRFLGKIETWAGDVENAGWLISIFMSPLDAHVNWSPLAGKVVGIRHESGRFSLANTWESLSNEKNEIVIQSQAGRIKVLQIAGFVARRIECWVREGQSVAAGEKIGMIRLGSQVSLILPKDCQPCVKKGQKVTGGETPVARMKN